MRRMIDVYSVPDREAVIVEIPGGHKNAGKRHGQIRARLHDDTDDTWWFEVSHDTDTSTAIDAYPIEWCRRPELDDYEGMVPEWQMQGWREKGLK